MLPPLPPTLRAHVRNRRQFHALRHLQNRDEECPCQGATYEGFTRGWPRWRPPTVPRPVPTVPDPEGRGVYVDLDAVLAVCRYHPENEGSIRRILATSLNVALEKLGTQVQASEDALELVARAVDATLVELRAMGMVFRRDPSAPREEPASTPRLTLAMDFAGLLAGSRAGWECAPEAEPQVRAALETAIIGKLEQVGQPTTENMKELVAVVDATFLELETRGLVRRTQSA